MMNDRMPWWSWLRALLLGSIGVVCLATLTHFNDTVLGNTMFIGNHLPLSVFGSLILFLLTVNVLLQKLRAGWAFDGREIAVALCLVLAVCSIPGSGLMRSFPQIVMMPHHLELTESGWKSAGVIREVPPQMLANVTDAEQVSRYLQGDAGDSSVPWAVWRRPLGVWLPILIFVWLAVLGLALLVHPQWSKHELLPYPIAQFASALLPTADRPYGHVFRERLFWMGGLAVLAIHLNNLAATSLFRDHWIQIPLSFNLRPIFVSLGYADAPPGLTQCHLYFAVIAFAFLLASDVSLSVGVAPFVFLLVGTQVRRYGIPFSQGSMMDTDNPQRFLVFGAYLGMFAMIVYAGRRYYLQTLRAAVGLRAADAVESASVNGLRLAALGSIGAVVVIAWKTGLDWQLAVCFVALLLIAFVVMGRIIAETGLFFNNTFWFAGPILVGVLGPRAAGPEAMTVLLLLSAVLMVSPREALMPFMVNALHLADRRRAALAPATAWTALALVAGLALAVVVTLRSHYQRGAPTADAWATFVAPSAPFVASLRATQRLDAQGALEAARALDGFARFAAVRPDGSLIGVMLLGAALVIGTYVARTQWRWWPLHPVLFLVWTTWPIQQFAWSFLFGWMLKTGVNRYAGAAGYRALKPLVFGLVAGELVAGFLAIVSGLLYHAATNQTLPPFRIMPG